MPEWLRKYGVGTQRELVLFLMPYNKPISWSELLEKFLKIMDHQQTSDYFSWTLRDLRKAGYIDRVMIDGRPYHVRKIAALPPKTKQAQIMLDRGLTAHPKRPPAPPDPAAKLTLEDVKYIHENPHGLTVYRAAEMYGVHHGTIRRIRAGKTPLHLRRSRARPCPSGNPARI